jgi:hypothetical protein
LFGGREAGVNASLLKTALLAFWCVWLSVVCAGNLCDGLMALGVLGDGWKFASGNYEFLVTTTARYDAPHWLNALLFAGVIAWEGLAALLFALAARDVRRQEVKNSRWVYPAFLVSLLLWGAFMVADELLIQYAVEATHVRLLTAQLATLLVVVLLPEGIDAKN